MPGDRALHARPSSGSACSTSATRSASRCGWCTSTPTSRPRSVAQRPFALLDEYQDTNYAQRVLLTSIYGEGSARHRGRRRHAVDLRASAGAHVRNIIEFPEHFAPADYRVLTHQPAQRADDRRARQPHPEPAWPARSRRSCTRRRTPPSTASNASSPSSDVEEATQIATDIADTVAQGEHGWSERAVLCRTRSLIGPIADALERRGVPVDVVGIGGLLERPEIVDLLAWLELLAEPSRNVALVRLLRGPAMRIGDRDFDVARPLRPRPDFRRDRRRQPRADRARRRGAPSAPASPNSHTPLCSASTGSAQCGTT